MKIICKLMVLALIMFVAGCGSGNSNRESPSDVPDQATGSSITLSSSLGQNDLLAKRGFATITATLTNDDGLPVRDGTSVFFKASSGAITEQVNTIGGKVTATYFADNSDGVVTIVASNEPILENWTDSGALVANILIPIASGAAASIEIKNITPERLGLKGTGTNEIGTVVFVVRDADGGVVQDGETVNFSLVSPVGGAEFVSASTVKTVGGEVSVSLVSGSVPGVATITAFIDSGLGTISTQARITMGYGMPDQFHIGLAFEGLNVPGLVRFGVENTLTAYIADRFSNPVPANTPVYFASNCGTVALGNTAGVSTNMTNNFGIASATAVTTQPTPPSSGLCTYIIWTEGEEAYIDANGNGRFDQGETFFDLGEPYIDANGNGQYDLGEIYFDLDGNGQYTPSDGQWSGNTFVWTSGKVRWSGITAKPLITPSSFNVATGSLQNFTLNVADITGGPLPGGTTISVTSDCDNSSLVGDTDVTLGDAVTGPTVLNFSLISTDDETGDAKTCSITAVVSAEVNGTESRTITGTID